MTAVFSSCTRVCLWIAQARLRFESGSGAAALQSPIPLFAAFVGRRVANWSLSLREPHEARRSASSLYRDAPARSWLPGATLRSPARRAGRNTHFTAFESPRARCTCLTGPVISIQRLLRSRHSMTGCVAGRHTIRPHHSSRALGRARSEGGHSGFFELRTRACALKAAAGLPHSKVRFLCSPPLPVVEWRTGR